MSGPDAKVMMKVDAAGVVVVLALSAAAYLAGFKPVLDRQAMQKQQAQTLVQQRHEATHRAASLASIRGELMKVRDEVKTSSIQLQSAAYLNQHLAQVTEVAIKCSLQVDEVQPGNIAHSPRYDQVPIEVSGSGSYADCVEFLQRLHKAYADTGVSSLEVRGRPDDPAHRAAFRFGLVWYAAPTLSTADAGG